MKLGTALKIFITILAFLLDRRDCHLDEHFKYYEFANQKHLKHVIKKRSLDNEQSLEIKFKNKNYKLELQEEHSLFAPDFKIFSVDERDVATEIKDIDFRVFHGYVSGKKDKSKVSAILGPGGKLGSFVVKTPEDTFAGESLRSYEKNAKNADDLIIYSQSDIKTTKRKGYHTCGNADMAHKQVGGGGDNDLYSKRVKRSPSSCQSSSHKACILYLAVDYSFFQHIGGGDFIETWKIVVLIIDQVNEIFKNTRFGVCGKDFGFQIGKMQIYQNYSLTNSHFNHDRLAKIDAYDFLCMFGSNVSSPELPKYCLGHLFTAKSMLLDILGLSNVGSTNKSKPKGGVCSKIVIDYIIKDHEYCFRKATKQRRSCNETCFVNTGFTTFTDSYSNRLPSLQAMLVVAHELGHSFGSHHDKDNNSMCVPASYPGYFLMYEFAVSGTEPNNKIFSNCSIMEIKNVLENQAASCFVAYNTSVCGNYKVEPMEKCDDGRDGSKCCTSHCSLVQGAQCSDINNECCRDCKFAPKNVKCRQNCSCREDALCDGESAICPKSKPVSNNKSCRTPLSNLKGMCRDGDCVDMCNFMYNQVVCYCQGENMCKVCCKDSSVENSTCELYRPSLENLPDGMACAFGVCEQGECKERLVSQVQRLWPIIDIKDISSLVIFTKNNIVGLVVVVSLMVWIPASCFVGRLDRKNMKAELEMLQWMSNSQTTFVPEKSKIRMRNSVGTH